MWPHGAGITLLVKYIPDRQTAEDVAADERPERRGIGRVQRGERIILVEHVFQSGKGFDPPMFVHHRLVAPLQIRHRVTGIFLPVERGGGLKVRIAQEISRLVLPFHPGKSAGQHSLQLLVRPVDDEAMRRHTRQSLARR